MATRTVEMRVIIDLDSDHAERSIFNKKDFIEYEFKQACLIARDFLGAKPCMYETPGGSKIRIAVATQY